MSRLVVFSFFRYAGLRVPDAFLRMGFQRFLVDRRLPTGRIRLMGCGSGDGFSVVPDLGAYCLMRVFADPEEEARLRRTRFYVWDDLARMQAFAYRATPHHGAGRASREEDWLSESMFVRFAIDRIEGDLERYPRLAALMES